MTTTSRHSLGIGLGLLFGVQAGVGPMYVLVPVLARVLILPAMAQLANNVVDQRKESDYGP